MSYIDASELSLEQIDSLAAQILRFDLPTLFRSFEWSGVGLPQAWDIRTELSRATQQAPLVEALSLSDKVHKWGFGSTVPKAIREDVAFHSALSDTITTWSKAPSETDKEQMIASLARLLAVPRVGIAKASKWICFIDQTRYAIYDSRVSLALREVKAGERRAFPIIARKALKDRQSWNADSASSDPQRMARYYWNYLQVIGRVAQQVRHPNEPRLFYPAEVEMALFMLGNVWPSSASRLPLARLHRQ